jgi:hypothetical protein
MVADPVLACPAWPTNVLIPDFSPGVATTSFQQHLPPTTRAAPLQCHMAPNPAPSGTSLARRPSSNQAACERLPARKMLRIQHFVTISRCPGNWPTAIIPRLRRAGCAC